MTDQQTAFVILDEVIKVVNRRGKNAKTLREITELTSCSKRYVSCILLTYWFLLTTSVSMLSFHALRTPSNVGHNTVEYINTS